MSRYMVLHSHCFFHVTVPRPTHPLPLMCSVSQHSPQPTPLSKHLQHHRHHHHRPKQSDLHPPSPAQLYVTSTSAIITATPLYSQKAYPPALQPQPSTCLACVSDPPPRQPGFATRLAGVQKPRGSLAEHRERVSAMHAIRFARISIAGSRPAECLVVIADPKIGFERGLGKGLREAGRDSYL